MKNNETTNDLATGLTARIRELDIPSPSRLSEYLAVAHEAITEALAMIEAGEADMCLTFSEHEALGECRSAIRAAFDDYLAYYDRKDRKDKQ